LAAPCVTVTVRPATVKVPVRAPPVFALTVNPIEPDPERVPVATIQLTELLAFQLQLAVVVTLTVPVLPAAAAVKLVGDTLKLHGEAAWLTVKVRPAIVSVPVRAPDWFGATVKLTLPLPLPVLPAPTVIQLALLAAVHAHPLAVVTLALPPDPPQPTDWLSGETE
jgi:hypothetical protein